MERGRNSGGRAGALAAVFCLSALMMFNPARASEIPARKLALIQQALGAMKLDLKIRSLVDNRVEMRAQRVRADNPQMSDSLTAAVRATLAAVYDENLEGRDGLYPQVYAVFDRYLSEDDLKFAVNFNASDNGKRYRELAPRIVNESVEVGRRWSESLEPEIRRRLEERFRDLNLKIL